MGELAKREDSHATLMQVLETKEKKRKEKKIENKENVVLCLNFLFSLQQKSTSRQMEALLREEKNELALKISALKKVTSAQKNQLTHLVKENEMFCVFALT